jgi:hypothetical protein
MMQKKTMITWLVLIAITLAKTTVAENQQCGVTSSQIGGGVIEDQKSNLTDIKRQLQSCAFPCPLGCSVSNLCVNNLAVRGELCVKGVSSDKAYGYLYTTNLHPVGFETPTITIFDSGNNILHSIGYDNTTGVITIPTTANYVIVYTTLFKDTSENTIGIYSYPSMTLINGSQYYDQNCFQSANGVVIASFNAGDQIVLAAQRFDHTLCMETIIPFPPVNTVVVASLAILQL